MNEDLRNDLVAKYGLGGKVDAMEEIDLDGFYNSDGFWKFRQDMLTGDADRFCGNCTIAKESYKTFKAKNAERLSATHHVEQTEKIRELNRNLVGQRDRARGAKEALERELAENRQLLARVEFLEMITGSMMLRPFRIRQFAGWAKRGIAKRLKAGGQA